MNKDQSFASVSEKSLSNHLSAAAMDRKVNAIPNEDRRAGACVRISEEAQLTRMGFEAVQIKPGWGAFMSSKAKWTRRHWAESFRPSPSSRHHLQPERTSKAPHPWAALESLESRVLFSVNLLDALPVVDTSLAFEGPEAAIVADGAESQGPSLALSDTFLLHSNPGASHTIYLDFDGHITENTAFNSWKNISTIVTPAFDIDGDTSYFSDAELTRIGNIFQRVAEDFIPFDVDVTTEPPSIDALIKDIGGSDARWGGRVVIGGSSSWLGQSAGGVAYVGSFNWGSDTPGFVFEEQLGNGHEKYTAEAISHEAGHMLGLSHDGTSSASYYQGHGSGETGWAPLMGVGYYKNLSQWSRGDYPDASNLQDDLSIITSQNGFGYRTDDHGSTFASASALSQSGSDLIGSGIIERNTDYDVFSFNTDAGSISFDISPFNRGPNLDILAELFDATGDRVDFWNPVGSLGASFSVDVLAGTYFLRVSGAGEVDPAGPGYSDYGSLGQYTISGQAVDPPPLFSVSDVEVNEKDGTAAFEVSLSRASAGVVTIDVATVEDTAWQDSDYVGVYNQTIIFAAGETIKTVEVSITDDDLKESDETFTLRLSNATGEAIISDAEGVGTILANDQGISVSINDVQINEGNPRKGKNSGTRISQMTFTVNLSEAASQDITVNYSTADGTATIANDDYVAESGSVTFWAGQTSKTITIGVVGDSNVESNETFFLNLSAENADGQDVQGIGTIVNDDSSGGRKGGGRKAKAAFVDADATQDTLDKDSSRLAQAAWFHARPSRSVRGVAAAKGISHGAAVLSLLETSDDDSDQPWQLSRGYRLEPVDG